MSQVTIFHNNRCSKSRQTLKLIEDAGIEPKIVPYLENPPSKTQLKKVLSLLGLSPRELCRKNEADYKQAGFLDDSLSKDELIALMVEHPKVIERPIVVVGDKAVLGRPPENVLEILP